MTTRADAYRAAGINIDAGNQAVQLMTSAVRSTYGPEVLMGIGAFGGLFDAGKLKAMREPVLVASTDGVGTKTMVACELCSYNTIGMDIVNHCVNDILVQGAEPLFFMDYIAMPALDPQLVATVVTGAAEACRAAGCALLGGETAEMPGVYAPGELDLVGTIVGCVERDEMIDGTKITPGDMLLGLSSSGPHTNGFSLIRRIFPAETFGMYTELLGLPLGEALVQPHRSYLPVVRAIREKVHIKGLAHITGGGFIDNVPRILPEGTAAVIDRRSWQVPVLFQLIEREGHIDHDEMYRVFNMGIGMVVVVAPEDADAVIAASEGEARIIGHVVAQQDGARVVMQ
ncbi:MAG: phosphoribosylformylglycinamidine cyclo-ligase [Chloroflexi bacterium]|nr:phosphoribosylformylglycinamidine cyclo-ligase [Chloroflexota bacterium]